MRVIWILLTVVTTGFVLAYLFYYNKPHRDIEREGFDYELTAGDLYSSFQENETAAHQKFYDRVILVSGDVKQVIDRDDLSIILLEGAGGVINCEMNEKYDDLINYVDVGENIQIKCLYVGYNDLLEEIQLKNCKIEDP